LSGTAPSRWVLAWATASQIALSSRSCRRRAGTAPWAGSRGWPRCPTAGTRRRGWGGRRRCPRTTGRARPPAARRRRPGTTGPGDCRAARGTGRSRPCGRSRPWRRRSAGPPPRGRRAWRAGRGSWRSRPAGAGRPWPPDRSGRRPGDAPSGPGRRRPARSARRGPPPAGRACGRRRPARRPGRERRWGRASRASWTSLLNAAPASWLHPALCPSPSMGRIRAGPRSPFASNAARSRGGLNGDGR
jgi:hypothetical protein